VKRSDAALVGSMARRGSVPAQVSEFLQNCAPAAERFEVGADYATCTALAVSMFV